MQPSLAFNADNLIGSLALFVFLRRLSTCSYCCNSAAEKSTRELTLVAAAENTDGNYIDLLDSSLVGGIDGLIVM